MAIKEDAKKQEEKVFIDPLAAGLEDGEATTLDTEADAYERLAPPPAGRYDVHVMESDECYEKKFTEAGEIYYVANLEAKIVNAADENVNGFTVFPRVSTFISKGKTISTMAYVLLKLGYPKEKLTGEITPVMLVKKFCKWIRGADRIAKGCLLDWQGWSQLHEKVVFSKMSDFPANKDGGHDHIVQYKAKGMPTDEVVAKLKLKDWGGKAGQTGGTPGQAGKASKAAPVVVKRPAPAAAPADDDDDAGTPVVPPKGKAAAAPAAAPGKAKAAAKPATAVSDLLAEEDSGGGVDMDDLD